MHPTHFTTFGIVLLHVFSKTIPQDLLRSLFVHRQIFVTHGFHYSTGLVNKERELAGLKLEEKEGEASLWRQKFFELKASDDQEVVLKRH